MLVKLFLLHLIGQPAHLWKMAKGSWSLNEIYHHTIRPQWKFLTPKLQISNSILRKQICVETITVSWWLDICIYDSHGSQFAVGKKNNFNFIKLPLWHRIPSITYLQHLFESVSLAIINMLDQYFMTFFTVKISLSLRAQWPSIEKSSIGIGNERFMWLNESRVRFSIFGSFLF